MGHRRRQSSLVVVQLAAELDVEALVLELPPAGLANHTTSTLHGHSRQTVRGSGRGRGRAVPSSASSVAVLVGRPRTIASR